MPKPFPKKHPITQIRDGRTYYLLETPLEGYTKSKAEERCEQFIKEYGFKDAFIDFVDGFYYVYGDPGITVEELQKHIIKFTLIENAQEIIDKIGWSTFREKHTEKWFHIECRHCGYQWKSQSQMNLVTCPSCGFKTPRNLPGDFFHVEER